MDSYITRRMALEMLDVERRTLLTKGLPVPEDLERRYQTALDAVADDWLSQAGNLGLI